MEQNKKILLIYHKEDADGLFSASICWNAILNNDRYSFMDKFYPDNMTVTDYINKYFSTENNNDKIELFGTTYAELSDLIVKYGSYVNLIDSWSEKYSQIIMTDISFNETKAMKYIYDKFGINFVWLDHHAPVIEASHKEGFDNIPGTRETYCSAVMHAWKYFYGGLPIQFEMNLGSNSIPWVVRAVSAYDSFNWGQHRFDFDTVFQFTRGFEFYIKKDINKTIEFTACLIVDYIFEHEIKSDCKLEFHNRPKAEFFDYMNDFSDSIFDKISEIRYTGKTIVNYEEYNWQYQVEAWGDFGWSLDGKYSGKRKAVAMFIQSSTCSAYFKSLKKTHPDMQNAIVFKKNPQNDEWTVFVYNINIEDDKVYHVGNYLKKRYKRGGGHAGAGGASLTKAQFVRILNSKNL